MLSRRDLLIGSVLTPFLAREARALAGQRVVLLNKSKTIEAYLASKGLSGSVAGANFEDQKFWLPTLAAGSISGASNGQLIPRWATEAEWLAQYVATGTTQRTYFTSVGAMKNDLAANALRYSYVGGRRWVVLENVATNLLLNSATLSTQDITTAATAYTLSFYGTGSVTLSGTSTAGPLNGTSASNRVSLTFTPTAGTLTLTVSGTVSNAQLEAQSFASSYIPTTDSSVQRPVETFQLPAVVEALLKRSEGFFLVRGKLLSVAASTYGRILGFSSDKGWSQGANDAAGEWNGSNYLQGTLGSGSMLTGFAMAAGWTAAGGRSISLNGSSVVSDANKVSANLAAETSFYLARGGTLSGVNPGYGNGLYNLIALFPARNDARMPALTPIGW